MRLIDTDKLKEVIHCAYSDDFEIIEKIDKQPTAFDVDKVVEQLKNLKEKDVCEDCSCVLCKYNEECRHGAYADQKVIIDKAIGIVKGGGENSTE